MHPKVAHHLTQSTKQRSHPPCALSLSLSLYLCLSSNKKQAAFLFAITQNTLQYCSDSDEGGESHVSDRFPTVRYFSSPPPLSISSKYYFNKRKKDNIRTLNSKRGSESVCVCVVQKSNHDEIGKLLIVFGKARAYVCACVCNERERMCLEKLWRYLCFRVASPPPHALLFLYIRPKTENTTSLYRPAGKI